MVFCGQRSEGCPARRLRVKVCAARLLNSERGAGWPRRLVELPPRVRRPACDPGPTHSPWKTPGRVWASQWRRTRTRQGERALPEKVLRFEGLSVPEVGTEFCPDPPARREGSDAPRACSEPRVADSGKQPPSGFPPASPWREACFGPSWPWPWGDRLRASPCPGPQLTDTAGTSRHRFPPSPRAGRQWLLPLPGVEGSQVQGQPLP